MTTRWLLGVVIATTACNNLTKVSAPDIVQPGSLQNQAGAVTQELGALSLFYTEYGLSMELSGLLTDELTFPSSGAPIPDTRIIPDGGPTSSPGLTYPGQRTRVNALIGIGLLQQYAPTPRSRIGELFAVAGTAETLMAEQMCSGVPLATIVNGRPVAGSPTTTATLYAHALTQFDSADRYSVDSARILDFSKIVRARTLLDIDSLAAAAQAVSGVPTAYLYQAQFSATTLQANPLAQTGFGYGNAAVSNREGINGLPFVSASDPRIPIDSSKGLGTDGYTMWYAFVPDLSLGAPVTIASGVEARLIEAEAALRAGDVAGWTADLNALRADSMDTGVHGLLPLTPDSTMLASADMRIDVMFRERAFWLFLTSHRQGDLRRLIRQYGRTQDKVFPTGLYKNTGTQYGTDITFPITGENVNSIRPECLNRDP